MAELVIDKTKTALVVIDFQKGIIAQPTRHYPAQEVKENAAKLVDMFRKKDAGTSCACHYAKDNAKVISNESFSNFSCGNWNRYDSDMREQQILV